MSIFTSPILEINLKALLENYLLLKKLSAGSIAAAVVKNDAYGLGAVEVARVLYEKGECRHFFVAHAFEGAEIAKVVKDAKIYVLQGIGQDSLPFFKKHKLIPVISSPQMLAFWRKNQIKDIKPVINVETGLNRLGFRNDDLQDIDENEFCMVMSHLACADDIKSFMNEKQLSAFKEIREKYFPNLPASLAASDGTFLGKDFQLDMVRLGAAIYGINTTPYRSNKMQAVVRVKAPVLEVADLKKGDFAGYGATFKAKKDMRIAIASIGYGDGIMRSLSNKGRVLGRVSMDNLILDVSDQKGLKVGDFVDILNDEYTLDDMGAEAGTIGYEVLSDIGHGKRFIRKCL